MSHPDHISVACGELGKVTQCLEDVGNGRRIQLVQTTRLFDHNPIFMSFSPTLNVNFAKPLPKWDKGLLARAFQHKTYRVDFLKDLNDYFDKHPATLTSLSENGAAEEIWALIEAAVSDIGLTHFGQQSSHDDWHSEQRKHVCQLLQRRHLERSRNHTTQGIVLELSRAPREFLTPPMDGASPCKVVA